MRRDDPAGQLLKLLEGAARAGEARGGRRLTARQAWSMVLDVAPDDAEALLVAISAVYALPSEIRAAVVHLPLSEQPRVAAELGRLERMFLTRSLESSWEDYARDLDRSLFVSLADCSNLFRSAWEVRELEPTTLTRLHDRAADLLDEVLSSPDLSVGLRAHLADILLDLLRALDIARVDGGRAVVAAIEQAAGQQTLRKEVSEQAKNSSLGKKVLGFLAGLALTLDLGLKALDLDERTVQLSPWDVPPQLEEPATGDPGGPSPTSAP